MKYCLLTGATGLLGRYLLRYLLPRDVPLAVLIRGNRTATARQRLETVLIELETQLQRSLPRPVLLTGDLSSPGLGLSHEERSWVRRRVDSVLHNAASLTFENGAPDEEPWKTNLTGTRLLLEATRDWGIRRFHHVSTAYVCGQRRGRVTEQQLDLGQAFGNDYEHSKLRAEQLVREADWLDAPTIYRPAIIVGDSGTGYSNTFHGFYTPLRIVHMLIQSVTDQLVTGDSLVQILGLNGSESKNLVPVDWVATVIGHLFCDPQHHGLVYHVTPEERTPVSQLCEVMERAVRDFSLRQGQSSDTSGRALGGLTLDSFLRAFHDKMLVYQAYWRDDPQFDATHRWQHAEHLPCPPLTTEILYRLCKFAVEANFWTSRGDRVQPAIDVNEVCSQFGHAISDPTSTPVQDLVQLRVTGCGGGDWAVRVVGSQPLTAEPGVISDVHLIASLNTQTLRDLVTQRTSLEQATRQGRICLENCPRPLSEVRSVLENIFARIANSSVSLI